MKKEPTQLERIAVQIEMLKLMKPYPQITKPEWVVIEQKAYELIQTLGLDNDDWKYNETH